MNKISVLIRDTPGSSLGLQTRKQADTSQWLCRCLGLGLPDPRTVRNRCLWFNPPLLQDFIVAACMD